LKLVEQGPSTDKAQLLASHAGQVPPEMELVEEKPQSGQRQPNWYLVRKAAIITGRDLKNARPSRGQFGSSAVTFFLTAAGAEKFSAVTGANVGKSLAIILDKRVQSAPRIHERISDTGQITGNFTVEEAND